MLLGRDQLLGTCSMAPGSGRHSRKPAIFGWEAQSITACPQTPLPHGVGHCFSSVFDNSRKNNGQACQAWARSQATSRVKSKSNAGPSQVQARVKDPRVKPERTVRARAESRTGPSLVTSESSPSQQPARVKRGGGPGAPESSPAEHRPSQNRVEHRPE